MEKSKVVINRWYGELELENKIRSIFDESVAGQIAEEDGNYYCIHRDHKTHKLYALTREAEAEVMGIGYTLEEGQEAVFNGEKVRGITFSEEKLLNEDNLMACVDLWGNIATEEEFDVEWYMENCI